MDSTDRGCEMEKFAMLINYGFCTGCHSCEIACAKEKGLASNEWGIKVFEAGPEKLGGVWEWDYVPVPSRLCDLCADRLSDGKKPSCALHCLAAVIEILPVEKVSDRLAEMDSNKVSVFVP